jgi:hypothetical protein
VKKGLFEWDGGCGVCGDETALHLCSDGYLCTSIDVGGGGGVGAVVRPVGQFLEGSVMSKVERGGEL